MQIEAKLSEMGLSLPPAPPPGGVYKPVLKVGDLLYVSGHGPVQQDGSLIKGKVGKDLSLEQGKLAARQVGLTILATVKAQLGSLDAIQRVVKVLGMVNCPSDFIRHPEVINGCSELFAQIWGNDSGIGVRSAVGMGSLPNDISVEIEVIFGL